MARRTSLITKIAREAARQARKSEADRKRYEREQIRVAKQRQRQQIQDEKEAKLRYIESRIEETDDLNSELAEQLEELYGILDHTLQVNDMISFSSLKINETFKDFNVPSSISMALTKPQLDDYTSKIKPLNLLRKLIPGSEKKYQIALNEAKQQFDNDSLQYEAKEQERLVTLDKLQAEYDQEKSMFELKVRDRNLEIDEFEESYRNGESEAVIAYNTMVLERSEYPTNFPQIFRLAYLPDSKELVIDYELPNKDSVPSVM